MEKQKDRHKPTNSNVYEFRGQYFSLPPSLTRQMSAKAF